MKYPKRYVPPKVTRVVLRQEDCPFDGPCVGRDRYGFLREVALPRRKASVDGDAGEQLGRGNHDEKV